MNIHPHRSDFLPIGLAIWVAASWVPLFADANTLSQTPSGSTDIPTTASIPNLAVTWAQSQMDRNFAAHVTSEKVQLQPWTGWCAKFVANAYGAPNCGKGSAIELWKTLPNRTMQNVPDNAPKGLLVFWSYTDKDGTDWGHVGIYVGNGNVISTAGLRDHPICLDAIEKMATKLTTSNGQSNGCKSQYLGYAPAPKNWPGPLLLRNSLLDFGDVSIAGNGFKKTLTLVNAGTQQITVRPMLAPVGVEEKTEIASVYKIKDPRLSRSIPPFSLLDEELELKMDPGQSVEVGVQFKPISHGDFDTDIHFLVNKSNLDNTKIGITSARVRGSTGLIAFVSSHKGRNREIFTMRPDGSGQHSLTHQFEDAFAPIWSSDGMKILFQGGGAGDFYIIDRNGGNLRKILDCGEVALEFPGVPSSHLGTFANWLPDGKTVAICAGSMTDSSNIYLVEVANLKRTTLHLAKAAWSPAWSPDGTKMAFTTFNSSAVDKNHPFQIWVADAKGTRQAPVSSECDVQDGPIWLPDGKRLIFVKHGDWSNGKQNNKLCMKNVGNGEFTETDFSWDVAGIVVSPDGQKIAFSPIHSLSPIYIFRLKGTAWRQEATIENGGYPTWSPDGTKLAFVSSDDSQIWLANADGTGRVRLTPISERVAPIGSESSGGSAALVSEKEWPNWSPTHIP